jgi:arylsulfatase
MLQSVGYATGMVGKWHLGDREPCLPLQHGFDSYLGLPYSNDMWDRGKVVKARTFPPLPLFDGNQVIDDDVDEQDQGQLTERYQQRALQFLRENTDKPFFLYFAHTFPHVPLFAGDKFRGRSDSGIYADVLEEFDEAVGAILREIRTLGLDSNTLVIFSSDNGPWLSYGDHAGTAGPLREGKGTVFEGGVRVPMLAQWPGHIPPGTTQDETAMTIDILPTIAKLVGAELPNHRIDGLDVSDLLMAIPRARCPHEYFYHYYRVNELQAIRSGPWKLILPHRAALIEGGTPGEGGQPGRYNSVEFDRPQLYNLNDDLGERVDLATKEPEVLARMLAIADQARVDLGDSLTKRIGLNVRPAADIDTGNR